MDASIVITALQAINVWFKILERKRQLRNEEREAVKAIHMAVNQTRAYIHSLGETGCQSPRRDLTKEAAISALWSDAYKALADVDQDLANRCLIKSGYWSEPDVWTQEQVNAANISLSSISKEAELMLNS